MSIKLNTPAGGSVNLVPSNSAAHATHTMLGDGDGGGAALIGYTPNGNSNAANLQTAIDSLYSVASINYIYNVNSSSFSVTHNANINALNTDKQIYLFGDSHGWGQGAPHWDQFSGSDYSSHSASLFNLGFMQRIESHIKHKLNFDEKVYTVYGVTGQRMLPSDIVNPESVLANTDYISRPLKVVNGLVKISTAPIIPTISANKAWFTPFANNTADDVNYKINIYREKLFKGRFNASLAELQLESKVNFAECGKEEYFTLIPLPGVAGSGGSFVTITDNNLNILGEYNTGVAFYLRFNNNSDYISVGCPILTPGTRLFIPGFGSVVTGEVVNLSGVGNAVKIFASNGTSYPTGLEKFIYAGMRIYSDDYISHTTMAADPSNPFRMAFISFRTGLDGRKFNISLGDGSTASSEVKLWGHNKTDTSLKPLWNFDRTGYPLVYLMYPTGERALVTSGTYGITINSTYIQVDTYNNSSVTDNVLCVDFGARVHGRLLIDDAGYNVASTGIRSYIRGVMFDNNGVSNYSMGAHSIGDWLGLTASYVDGARDHLGDIIEYAKVTPHLVITELPLVNEYLRQTTLVTFKANIATFISRLNNTLNPGATKKTDFLFFTTIGGQDVDYLGATSSAITYDMYATAAKEQCITSNAGFVDCRAMFKSLVVSGIIDQSHLYADNNHPSGFANEYIAKKIIEVIDTLV